MVQIQRRPPRRNTPKSDPWPYLAVMVSTLTCALLAAPWWIRRMPPIADWHWTAVGSIGTALGAVGTVTAAWMAYVAASGSQESAAATAESVLEMRKQRHLQI